MKKLRGFSLVELLIGLAIIALLISIAVYGSLILKKNSRDATRSETLGQMHIAMEKFFSEKGRYPEHFEITFSNGYWSVGGKAVGNTQQDYLCPSLDSSKSSTRFCYQKTLEGNYKVAVKTERGAWINLGTHPDECPEEYNTLIGLNNLCVASN
jgi:prepilin-type N-terminal cleavage/methylation domain-containing protein